MNVGDYVITNDRLHIGKIYNINEFREPSMMYAIDFPNADDFIFMGENDFKSSPNIIDLLDVGDYVNGYKVECVNAPYGVYIEIPFVDSESIGCNVDLIRTKEIESIVTHEMFESMEYKVGD